MKKLIILFLLVILSCKPHKHNKVLEFVDDIHATMSKEELEIYKNSPQDSIAIRFPYIYLYNDVFLPSEKGEQVRKYFGELGVIDNVNITNILFTILHRKLNKRKLDIDALIKSAVDNLDRFKENQDKINGSR